jgi:hypothetical protein
MCPSIGQGICVVIICLDSSPSVVASLLLSQDSSLPAMHYPSRSLPVRSAHGGSLVPILIVVAALALSTAIFFLFTKKKMLAQQGAAAPLVTEVKPAASG